MVQKKSSKNKIVKIVNHVNEYRRPRYGEKIVICPYHEVQKHDVYCRVFDKALRVHNFSVFRREYFIEKEAVYNEGYIDY